MANLEDVREFWDEKIKEKGLEISATAFDFQLKNLEVFYICKFLNNLKKRIKVLDLGCGTGYLGVVLTQKFKNIIYYGVDYSKTAIKYANKRINDLGIKNRVRFYECNAVYINKLFPLNYFDVVITERLLINLAQEKTK